jgi:2-keto-myo-inositol isomerase
VADFIYCLNTSTIRPASLPEKIQAAGEAGYRAIELWHDDVDAYLAQGGKIADLRKMLADWALAVPSMIYLGGWFETTGEEHARNLGECRRRMDQAAELGAAICVAGPPGGKADLALGTKHYRELLEIGRAAGVRPAIEFLGFVEEFNRLEPCVQLARDTGDAEACVVIDPFHLFRGGSGIEAMAAVGLAPREIGILHFNDAPASPPRDQQHDPDRVLPGDGQLDLRRFVQIAREIGYRGALSLELFNEELWRLAPLEVARLGLSKMRAVVEG